MHAHSNAPQHYAIARITRLAIAMMIRKKGSCKILGQAYYLATNPPAAKIRRVS